MTHIHFLALCTDRLQRHAERKAAEQTPLEFLKQLVDIPSGTTQVAGAFNQVQAVVEQRLKAIGMTVTYTDNPSPTEKSGRLLVATLAGKDPRFVTLLGHADTVFDLTASAKGITVSGDGTTAHGPGVIDDKGGLVVLILGLERYLHAVPVPPKSIRVIVSPNEETGSNGFLDALRAAAHDSSLVLGFEPALDDHTIIDSRRGDRWYKVKVAGREAHAGRAHAEGINACWDLAQKLDRISKLTDYKRDVTVSVGHMEGGKDKFNTVCGEASAKIDTRFSDTAHRDLLDQKIRAIMNAPAVRAKSDQAATKTEIEVMDDCPPFSPSKISKSLIARYLKMIGAIESTQITSARSGGASDSNYLSNGVVPIIDGLGPVGGKMHTGDEFLTISSLRSRADALAQFLKSLPALEH